MANDGQRKAGCATDTCPLQECTVVVQVDRKDGAKLSQRVDIEVQGPTPKGDKTAPVIQRQIFEHLTPCADEQVYAVSITPHGQEEKYSIKADPTEARLNVPGGATGTFLFELSKEAWIKFKVVYEKPPAGVKAEVPAVTFSVKRTGQPNPEFSPDTGEDGLAMIPALEADKCDVEGMTYGACVLEVIGEVQSA